MKIVSKIIAPLSCATMLSAETIKDEAQVPPYVLPELLSGADGAKLTEETWPKQRAELIKLAEEHIYGKTLLGKPAKQKYVVLESKSEARGGLATRLRVEVQFEGSDTGRKMELLVYLPNRMNKPAGTFLGLNFDGNYTLVDDRDLPLPKHYVHGLFDNKTADHTAQESARGIFAYMLPLDLLLEKGFAVATACYGELEADAQDQWKNGVRGLADAPGPGDWGAVGAWAWGLSRAMDYLETVDRVDAKKVAVYGFSRLGKAALWAGIQDERFAGVISLQSGAGGLALGQRIFGETVGDLTTRFPHWFCQNYGKYANNEKALPVDSHQLAACVAPRALLGLSAAEDLWADPQGEFLALQAASPIFELLGQKGLKTEKRPSEGKLENSNPAYFIRKGQHDVILQDWVAMMSFAGKQLQTPSPSGLAVERYARELAVLPPAEQKLWKEYLAKSDALRAADRAALDKELKAAGKTEALPAPEAGESFKVDGDSFTASLAAVEREKLANNMLTWQLPSGGWSKAISYATPRMAGTAYTSQDNIWHYAGTFDNRSTTAQTTFLAQCHRLSPNPAIKEAAERGLDLILTAQMPHGGFPQGFPLEGDYHDNVTLNDSAMMQVLEVLRLAATGEDGFDWLDAPRKAKAQAALDRGLGALYRLQIPLEGKPTVWCAQYSPLTLAPTSARGYEPASLSGSESVEVLRFLFKVRPVTPELEKSVELAQAWVAAHPFSSEPTWGRFYDIHTQKTIFPGKNDGKFHPSLEALKAAGNKTGYDYFSNKAKDLPKWVEKWRKQLAKEADKR